MYTETTRSIKITVRPVYLEEHSSPADDHYVWAYHVRIENRGDETVQLRNRHWRITDAHGRRSYVTSAGAGPSIGKHILMSYLPPDHAVVGAKLQVQYMGELYPVTVATTDSTSLFDPDNARVRS